MENCKTFENDGKKNFQFEVYAYWVKSLLYNNEQSNECNRVNKNNVTKKGRKKYARIFERENNKNKNNDEDHHHQSAITTCFFPTWPTLFYITCPLDVNWNELKRKKWSRQEQAK